MIIVTGGAGFIGSNLVHELNRIGLTDILVVDNLATANTGEYKKFRNLDGAKFADYMDKREFRAAIAGGKFAHVQVPAILHQGACSNTLEDDGQYMMDNNFTYSKELLHFALGRSIPFVYASTAAVYGLSTKFASVPENEHPLNVYGFSKLVFDNYVRRMLPDIRSTVVGLRYFNVFGPREQHKGRMASVLHHFTKQLKETGTIRMFTGSGGYGDGEQRRDFVYVRDLCRMNIFFAGLGGAEPQYLADHLTERTRRQSSRIFKGIANAGTGAAHTFKQVAETLFQVHAPGKIEFIPFPADLENRYQHFTQADVTGLRELGYTAEFTPFEAAVRETFAQAS